MGYSRQQRVGRESDEGVNGQCYQTSLSEWVAWAHAELAPSTLHPHKNLHTQIQGYFKCANIEISKVLNPTKVSMTGHAMTVQKCKFHFYFQSPFSITTPDCITSGAKCIFILFRQLRTSSSDFRKVVLLNVYKIRVLYIYNRQYNKGDPKILNSLNSTRSHSNSYIFNSPKLQFNQNYSTLLCAMPTRSYCRTLQKSTRFSDELQMPQALWHL